MPAQSRWEYLATANCGGNLGGVPPAGRAGEGQLGVSGCLLPARIRGRAPLR